MFTARFTVVFVALSLALPACSSLGRPKTQRYPRGGDRQNYIATQANTRLAYFAPDGASLAYCAEPMPDATTDESLRLVFAASRKAAVKVDAKGNANVEVSGERSLNSDLARALTMRELGGRNPSVLITRELLYRLCELNLNMAGRKVVPTTGKDGQPINMVVPSLDVAYANTLATYRVIADAALELAKAERATADATRALVDPGRAAIAEAAVAEVTTKRTRVNSIVTKLVQNSGVCTTAVVDPTKIKALTNPNLVGIAPELAKARTCAELKDMLEMLSPSILAELDEAIKP